VKKFLQVADMLIYWSLVLMPFSVAIAPGLANAFIGIFSVLFIIKKLIKRQALFTPRAILLCFGLFLLTSLLSMINSVDYRASLQGITKLLKYFLIIVVCCEEIKDKLHLKRIFASICAGVCLVTVDALWQMAFSYDFIRHNIIQAAIGLPRPTAAFPNCNIFGIYVTVLTPMVLGLTFFYFKGRARLLLLMACILGLSGVLLSLSRGAGLGIYLAVLFLSIAQRKKMITLILIGILAVAPFVMPSKIKEWAKKANYNPLVLMFNEDRVSIYNNTINMIKHHPFIGVGVNTFSKNYGKYKTAEAEKYCHTADTIYAHNIYLQMAGETGLLGLAVFLLFLFQVFRSLGASIRSLSDKYLNVTGISLFACLIAFLVNGLTETSLYYPRVVMIFWYLIGVCLSLARMTPGLGKPRV